MTPESDNLPKSAAAGSEDPWVDCTWEGSERATLRAGAMLTFAEKMEALEEMHALALQFQANRKKLGLKTIFQDGHIED